MQLYIHAFAHLLVDALCAATIFGPLRAQTELAALIWLYNTLAFSTQCLVGLLADRMKGQRGAAAAAMLCVIVGFALPLPALGRIILVGLGNSLFHAAAGTETLRASGGRAAPLGIFVAPGAIGVTLGSLFPGLGPVLAALLAAAAAASLLCKPAAHPPVTAPAILPKRRSAAALLLTAAVAVRAVGGSGVSFPWQNGPLPVLLTTGCVFAGKLCGGFLCDRLGPKRSAWLSVPAAALLITFCAAWALPAMLGQFAINLTMPVTLWLLYRAMPEAPGFAFGLAASALWPGTVAGKLIALTGPVRWVFLLLCFLFGLAAILYAASRLRKPSDPTL